MIYNFHLVQNKYELDCFSLIEKIKKVLNRDIKIEEFELIQVYGLEAFMLASLVDVNDHFLKLSWMKINKIWTVLSKYKSLNNSIIQKKYIILGKSAFLNEQYTVVSTSIDHCLKYIKIENFIDVEFLDFLSIICPLMVKIKKNNS